VKTIGNIDQDGEVRAIASGALATGDTVIVNSDGTVSVVAGSDASAGTPVTFEASTASEIAATFDSNSNKVVIAYGDEGNSNYGTAIVGTVSGSSISFGTPVVFVSQVADFISATFDTAAGKVVIAYRDNRGSPDLDGVAIVGTVSGSSISFGSPVIFENDRADHISICYDSDSQKVVVAYSDTNNSSYGTAIVGTVSGTSISFGSATVFNNSGDTRFMSSAYDANAQKVVIAYRDNGNSGYGEAAVGTVSGTSISFGTPVVFLSRTMSVSAMAYDANAQKIVLAYRDAGNSNYPTCAVGTVSGTSISFGTPVVIDEVNVSFFGASYDSNSRSVVISYGIENGLQGTAVVATVSGTSITLDTPVIFESGETKWVSSAFDSNSNKVVISYQDKSNSEYGKAVVFSPASTNLTSEGFIGFANSGYADGQSAAINSTCSVDNNQSGLTAGETYYVQTDGTLGTTPADPSVLAGTAISSNSIIVKG